MSSSHTSASPTICLVGAGNMGGAMLAGWIAAGHATNTSVVDPSPPTNMAEMIAESGVAHFTTADEAKVADYLIVAVKPQIIKMVLPGLSGLVGPDTVLVSVAAGTTISQLAEPFAGEDTKVVRAMPNTPAMVQRGVTACVANDKVTDVQKETVSSLMQAIGTVAWIEDEALMDAVTSISGCGPAYVFHLAEVMAQAGEAVGLDPELAQMLARETVSGAGELMRQSDLSAAKLRENVTSPNGVTQAALEVLMGSEGFPSLMQSAVEAAVKRSKELAEE